MNRCEADLERRKRALNDCALVQRAGNLERRIEFEVGYDHSAFKDDCGGGGHGKHGMTMRFVLIGPHGAVQWVACMINWYPGNIRNGDVGSAEPVSLVPAMQHRHIDDGMAWDLGYHSPIPQYEDQTPTRGSCEYLPGQQCYYDGSSLNAQPLLEAFLEHGPMAVWAALARYYTEALAITESAG
jgi:hypothetical protein